MPKRIAVIIVRRSIAVVLLLVSVICAHNVFNKLWLSIGNKFNLTVFCVLAVITMLGGMLVWGWASKNALLGVCLVVFGGLEITEKIFTWSGNVAPVVIPSIIIIGLGVFLIKCNGALAKREPE